MLTNFQEAFGANREATRQQIKTITQRAYAKKWCSTCKHFIPDDPYTPGFVTTGPTCAITAKPAMNTCPSYERMDDTQDRLRGWL